MDPNLNHLSSEAAQIAQLDNPTRIRRILSDRFVAYKHISLILNHIRFLILQPPQVRAWGLVVMGQPGSGKTMLARAIQREFPEKPAVDDSPLSIPAVMISMTGAREARNIFNRILEALSAPPLISMRVADRERLVLRLLRAARTQVLIVDEIQDVLSSTARQQQYLLDTIKLIMNELGIPVVALGVPRAMSAMKSDPHLNARFNYVELPQWKVGDELQALLISLERVLPLRRPSHLASPTSMKTIIQSTGGVLAKIVRLINHAAMHAIASGVERIDAAMLAAAADVVPAAEWLR